MTVQAPPSFIEMLRLSYAVLSRRDKLVALGLFFLLLIGAALEAFGIALIMPFIQVLNEPEFILKQRHLAWVYNALSFESTDRFVIFVGLILLCAYFFKNAFFVFMYFVQNLVFSRKRVSFAYDILSLYVKMPYLMHLQRNSAELATNVNGAQRVLDLVWLPMVLLTVESLVVAFVMGLLLFVQPMMTVIAMLVLGSTTALFYWRVRKRIANWGRTQLAYDTEMRKWFHQSLDAIREVKVFGREDFFLRSYVESFLRLAQVTRRLDTVNQLPRLFIETVVVLVIIGSVLAVLTFQPGGRVAVVSSLALFAVAAARLMPSMNRMVLAVLALRHGGPVLQSLNRGMNDVQQFKSRFSESPEGNGAVLTYNDKIELRGVSFSYPEGRQKAIDELSLTIAKGEAVAFVGQSGAGKSTVINMLTGLIEPTAGHILVDGRDVYEHLSAWRKLIGYVPQQIYLLDDTVKNNIAFGIPHEEIDDQRVWEVLRVAQLDGLIRQSIHGLDTRVGERGVKFSVGQQQRIGIARALYHNPSVLILDEATSALDNETEKAISKALDQLAGSKTIIMIAHRLTTVMKCDKIFFMRNGQLLEVGRYDELLKRSPDFSRFASTHEQQG